MFLDGMGQKQAKSGEGDDDEEGGKKERKKEGGLLTPALSCTSSALPGNRLCIIKADFRGVTGSAVLETKRMGFSVFALKLPVYL
jgi:hypothetical protein